MTVRSGIGDKRSSRFLHVVVTATVLLLLALTSVGVAGVAAAWSGWRPLVGSFALPELVIGLSWSGVGIFLAARRPTNPMGWLLLLVGVAALGDRAATALTEIGSDRGLPGAIVDVAQLLPLPPFPFLPGLVLVLFPDGRPPHRRWWWVLAPLLALAATATVGVRLAPDAALFAGPLWDLAAASGGFLLIAGVVALVLRRRRADPVLRLQVRGVLFTMGVAVTVVLVFVLLHRPWIGNSALALIPISIGAAVVRYRLYDLDRLLSRTVAYSLLVALLAAVYLGLVVALGAVARMVTGESGDLVVALSTLAVAALFQPMRQRTQRLVDRRFNRARYDAGRTVDAFGRSLRDEVSLDAIVRSLRATTGTTVHPATVGVVLIGHAEVTA